MLFKWGQFVGASGGSFPFKVECDVLHQKEWECIAHTLMPKIPPFVRAVPIPTGGELLAELLNQYKDKNADSVLFVDDVWNTGFSMRQFATKWLKQHQSIRRWHGAVAFARGARPVNVVCFAQIHG